MGVDFLPICDLLFNFISVTSYFCDIAFDILATYTLYNEPIWFPILFCALIGSLLLCQMFSMKWFIEGSKNAGRPCSPTSLVVYAIHTLQCGVLWRYSKLFTPIQMHVVKQEMRNLCILRMIHGFVESMTFLLIQGYLAMAQPHVIKDVNYVSIALSLFNLCWALASFNKNIRQRDVHRLVLTWIGVIFQFFWRLGTLTSRCIALVVYSNAHHYWIFLVTLLHWLCMFVWQFITRNSGTKKVSYAKNAFYCVFLSYIYIFCYLNLDDTNTKMKIIIYYLVVFAENILITTLWATSLKTSLDFTYEERRNVLITMFLSFVAGVFFMIIYYRHFHVRKISSSLGDKDSNAEEAVTNNASSRAHADNHNNINPKAVFNCTLNPALKKKKKLPSIVPPPPEAMSKPFWKEPLPSTHDPYYNIDNHSTTSVNDIHEKLQQKRDNQMQRLRMIENDLAITQPTKLLRPAMEFTQPPVLKRQPFIHLDHPHKSYHEFNQESSGDQGDVDSGDDFEWNRELFPGHLNTRLQRSHFNHHETQL